MSTQTLKGFAAITRNFVAGADLTKGYCVKFSSSPISEEDPTPGISTTKKTLGIEVCDQFEENFLGVVLNDTASGDVATVVIEGPVQTIVDAGDVTAGEQIYSDSAGKMCDTGSGKGHGVALEASSGADELIWVYVEKLNTGWGQTAA